MELVLRIFWDLPSAVFSLVDMSIPSLYDDNALIVSVVVDVVNLLMAPSVPLWLRIGFYQVDLECFLRRGLNAYLLGKVHFMVFTPGTIRHFWYPSRVTLLQLLFIFCPYLMHVLVVLLLSHIHSRNTRSVWLQIKVTDANEVEQLGFHGCTGHWVFLNMKMGVRLTLKRNAVVFCCGLSFALKRSK